ncbi:hypothetical protein E2I00_008532 [Balaenoptera physalus]|uniref:Uncharacterized protein n=1 Tax=Balaenoptera physalus TaxID=9770 RepID=A0A643BS40_BALPH|nr:hypothetical protein E2I00_008532 [Balaenoptera physalus]
MTPWTPVPSDSGSWSGACESPGGCCVPGNQPRPRLRSQPQGQKLTKRPHLQHAHPARRPHGAGASDPRTGEGCTGAKRHLKGWRRRQRQASSLKSASMAASPATRASAPPQCLTQGWQPCIRDKTPQGHPPNQAQASVSGGSGLYGEGAGATKPEPGRRDQQIVPLAAPQAPEAFTLKDKGLWAQLSSAQTSNSVDAATTAKTQSLQKTQTTSSWPSSRLSAAEVEAELRHLQEACLLLRLRMGKSSRQSPRTGCRSTAACSPRRVCRPARGSVSAGCGSGAQYPEAADPGGPRAAGGQAAPADPPGKVLMAELLPLVSKQEPLGPRWLVLCRAEHSLLCEGGQHFLPSYEKISLLTEPFPWPGPPPVPQDLQQRQAASAP